MDEICGRAHASRSGAAGVCGVPAVLQLIGLQMLPESPRWLVKQGRLAEVRPLFEVGSGWVNRATALKP